MASDRLRRKDLKAPDEFLTTTGRVLEYVRANPRQIATYGGALLLLVLLVGGVATYRSWQAGAAQDRFNEAYRLLQEGDLEQAARGFSEVADSGAAGPLDDVSLAFAGTALAELGRSEEAREAFRRLLDSADDATLRQLARYNLGLLAGNDGAELEQAVRSDGPYRPAAAVALVSRGTVDADPEQIAEAAEALPEELREYVRAQAGREGAAR